MADSIIWSATFNADNREKTRFFSLFTDHVESAIVESYHILTNDQKCSINQNLTHGGKKFRSMSIYTTIIS